MKEKTTTEEELKNELLEMYDDTYSASNKAYHKLLKSKNGDEKISDELYQFITLNAKHEAIAIMCMKFCGTESFIKEWSKVRNIEEC